MATCLAFKDLPNCCKGCKNNDWDSLTEYHESVYYCVKNLILPTVKGTCKKRET